MVHKGRPYSGHRAKPAHKPMSVRQQCLVQVAMLDRRGYSREEIAERLGISEPSVAKDLEEIHRRYTEAIVKERQVLVEERKAQLREVRREAWEAWEQSKQRVHKDKVEEKQGYPCPMCGGEGKNKRAGMRNQPCPKCKGRKVLGGSVIKTTIREGRIPANEYLRTIIETLRDESALEGLNAATKVNTNVNVVNWDSLLAQARQVRESEGGGLGDLIEAKLHAIEGRLIEESSHSSGNGHNGQGG